jgi:hypothetical protein
MSLRNIFSGIAIVLAAVVIASAMPDIKRYIRISTM